jgi:hypothetical protein
MSRSFWRNVCWYSVQNLLSYCLLSKDLKVKVYKILILPFVCTGVELGLSHKGKGICRLEGGRLRTRF